MTLRTRISLLVAGAVALAIFLVAGASFASAVREINVEADRFLLERADSLARGPFRGRFEAGSLFGPDRPVQLISSSGEPVAVAGIDEFLPVSRPDLDALEGQEAGTIHTVAAHGRSYRVVTLPVEGGGGIMLAQDLSEQQAVLDGLKARFALIGLLGAVAAGLIASIVVSRTMEPMASLARAAEHVATTQDLDHPIDVQRDDEVGRVAASFNTMLEALNTSKHQQQRLIDDASHELRTPLTSLRTNIELLNRAQDLDPKDRSEILADVEFELEELSALVAELVDLAKDVRTSDEPLLETRMGDLVERVAERARRRYDVEVVVEADDTTVMARPLLVERAVSNLLDNARKWNTNGRPIEVTVTEGRIAVRDHGAGIPPEALPHVFDRFYRADEARTMPGSGLGLAIVREVAEGHDGTAFAESDNGGAVVGFTLPTV